MNIKLLHSFFLIEINFFIGSSLTQQRCDYLSNLSLNFLYKPLNDIFLIINRNDLAIDNYNANRVNGNPVIGYTSSGDLNQMWVKENVDNKNIVLTIEIYLKKELVL